jgi:hypothetical protein
MFVVTSTQPEDHAPMAQAINVRGLTRNLESASVQDTVHQGAQSNGPRRGRQGCKRRPAAGIA